MRKAPEVEKHYDKEDYYIWDVTGEKVSYEEMMHMRKIGIIILLIVYFIIPATVIIFGITNL